MFACEMPKILFLFNETLHFLSTYFSKVTKNPSNGSRADTNTTLLYVLMVLEASLFTLWEFLGPENFDRLSHLSHAPFPVFNRIYEKAPLLSIHELTTDKQ
jgi:hypothetical protein